MSSSVFSSAHFHYVTGLIDAIATDKDAFIVKLAAAQTATSTATAPNYFIAAALSDHSILLYTLQLPSASSPLPVTHLLRTLRHHTAPITDLAFFNQHASFPPATPQAGNHILLSSSEDGTVTVHDCNLLTSPHPLITLRTPHSAPVFSIAGSGQHVLAGSESVIYVFDVRTGRLLHTLSDFHCNEVTAVAFHPIDTTQLFSASLDGTVCHFTLCDPDPDEWLQSSFQVEADVRRIGFFGPSADYLYALTTTEQLSLWHIERALCVSSYPVDIRQSLSGVVGCHIDYVMDCHYESESQRLFLLAGNNNGSVCITHLNRASVTPVWTHHSSDTTDYNEVKAEDVNVSIWTEENSSEQKTSSTTDTDAVQQQQQERKEYGAGQGAAMEQEEEEEGTAGEGESKVVDPNAAGHTAAVRDVLWLGSVLLSGGNDGKLCVWTSDVRSKPAPQSRQRRKSNAAMDD